MLRRPGAFGDRDYCMRCDEGVFALGTVAHSLLDGNDEVWDDGAWVLETRVRTRCDRCSTVLERMCNGPTEWLRKGRSLRRVEIPVPSKLAQRIVATVQLATSDGETKGAWAAALRVIIGEMRDLKASQATTARSMLYSFGVARLLEQCEAPTGCVGYMRRTLCCVLEDTTVLYPRPKPLPVAWCVAEDAPPLDGCCPKLEEWIMRDIFGDALPPALPWHQGAVTAGELGNTHLPATAIPLFSVALPGQSAPTTIHGVAGCTRDGFSTGQIEGVVLASREGQVSVVYGSTLQNIQAAARERFVEPSLPFKANAKDLELMDAAVQHLISHVLTEDRIIEATVELPLMECLRSKKWSAQRFERAIDDLAKRETITLEVAAAVKREVQAKGLKKPPRLLQSEGDLGCLCAVATIAILEHCIYAADTFRSWSIKYASRPAALAASSSISSLTRTLVALQETARTGILA